MNRMEISPYDYILFSNNLRDNIRLDLQTHKTPTFYNNRERNSFLCFSCILQTRQHFSIMPPHSASAAHYSHLHLS